MDFLIDFDKDLFLILNGWNHPALDSFWWFVTQRIYWIPLYAWFLFVLFKEYKSKIWIPLVFVVLVIVASDQGANVAKDFFHRLRPCHRIEWEGVVHTVNGYCGGLFGFFSGHAANAAALVAFLWLIVPSKRKSILWTGTLFGYALLVSLSRIFLGVHFPFDVLAGWIYGDFCGTITYFIARRFLPDSLRHGT